jgi:hypothetical protein
MQRSFTPRSIDYDHAIKHIKDAINKSDFSFLVNQIFSQAQVKKFMI